MNKTEMSLLLVFSLLVIISFLLITTPANTKSMSGKNTKIIFYKRGKRIILDSQSAHFEELQQKCEEFLVSATNVMRDFISKEKASIIKKNELAIEVVYRRPKEIEIPFFGSKHKANHLLIPLTGKYVNAGGKLCTAVFFYGPGYGPDYIGPHWAPKSVIEIKKILQSMGVNISVENFTEKGDKK